MTPEDQELRREFAMLERDLPRVAPREDLFADIRGRLEPEAPAAPRSWWPRWRTPALAAAAAAAVLVVAAVLVSGGPDAAAEAALVPHGGSGARGEVALFGPTTRDGHLTLEVRDLRPAPAGHHYTVWVLRAGSEEMTPVGSFAYGSGKLTLPLPGPGPYVALDISLQRTDAPPTHSGVSVAGATF